MYGKFDFVGSALDTTGKIGVSNIFIREMCACSCSNMEDSTEPVKQTLRQ